jgi:hypothetical protein
LTGLRHIYFCASAEVYGWWTILSVLLLSCKWILWFT